MALSDDRPRQLGRYRLLTRIGAGGMAEVFVAQQAGLESFNKLVTIKVIQEELASDPRFSAMLLNEARIAAQIRHAHVIDVYDVCCESGTYFIAMEYVPGQSLVAVIRKGCAARKIDIYSAARIVGGVAAGLEAVHSFQPPGGEALEVVHRDVSLGNVILGYDGTVKLVDFGVAKARGHLRDFGDSPGKLGYAAPEQLAGGRIDRRADIFGLGVVLWELLTHRRLFKTSDRDEAIAARAASIDPPSLHRREVPAELDAICMRALAADPADRYESAEEISRALFELLREANDYPDNRSLSAYMDAMFAVERAQLERHLAAKLSDPTASQLLQARSLLHGAAPTPDATEHTEVVAPLPPPPVADEEPRVDQMAPLAPRSDTRRDLAGAALPPRRRRIAVMAIGAVAGLALALGWQLSSADGERLIAGVAAPTASVAAPPGSPEPPAAEPAIDDDEGTLLAAATPETTPETTATRQRRSRARRHRAARRGPATSRGAAIEETRSPTATAPSSARLARLYRQVGTEIESLRTGRGAAAARRFERQYLAIPFGDAMRTPSIAGEVRTRLRRLRRQIRAAR